MQKIRCLKNCKAKNSYKMSLFNFSFKGVMQNEISWTRYRIP